MPGSTDYKICRIEIIEKQNETKIPRTAWCLSAALGGRKRFFHFLFATWVLNPFACSTKAAATRLTFRHGHL